MALPGVPFQHVSYHRRRRTCRSQGLFRDKAPPRNLPKKGNWEFLNQRRLAALRLQICLKRSPQGAMREFWKQPRVPRGTRARGNKSGSMASCIFLLELHNPHQEARGSERSCTKGQSLLAFR